MTSPYSRKIAAALDLCALVMILVICWVADDFLAGPWWMGAMLGGFMLLAIACVVHAGVLREWSY